MRRAVLILALLACSPVAAQSIGGGAVGGGGGGAAPDPTPVFDFDPGAHGSGPAQLSATDAFSMTTVVECDARTDTATDWVCGTGGTFTESDATGNTTIGFPAPFTETAARSTWFDRLAGKRAPNTTVGEVGSGVDVSFIMVASAKAIGALQNLGGKHDFTNSEGYGIRVSAGNSLHAIANGTTVGAYALDAIGQWNILEFQCDSGATNGARFYVNGALAGSAANCPATLANTTSAKNFSFGCRPNGSQNDCLDGFIAYARVQTCTGCMTTTAAQDAVAQRHAMELMGVWPTHAVDPVPVTMTRATPAYIDIRRDQDDGATPTKPTYVLRVGNGWMRVTQRREATGDGSTIVDGRHITGYFPEPAATNLLLQSTNYATTWAKLQAGDTVVTNSGLRGPSQEDDEIDRLEAASDVVGLEHGLRQTTSASLSAAYTYIFSVHASYTDDGSVAFRYLWLRDNTIGATAIGWFDLKTCQVISAGAGLKSFGTVVNGGTRGAARIRHLGDTGVGGYRWCRAEIVVQGTTATHDFDIGASKVSGTTTQTTSASERVLLLWHSQLERMAVAEGESGVNAGERSSSVIPTTTAAGTRNADRLRFDDANWPSTGGTILVSYLLEDGRVSNSAEDYATARTISVIPCAIEKDSSNYIQVEQTAEAQTYKYGFNFTINTAGVQQWDHTPDGFPAGRYQHRDGRFHWVRAVAMTNDARIFIDGETTASFTDQSAVTLPTIDAGGIAIGYAAATEVEWARGLIHRCAFFAQDYEAPNP